MTPEARDAVEDHSEALQTALKRADADGAALPDGFRPAIESMLSDAADAQAQEGTP